MPGTIVVEGMDINPQELDEAGWTTALGGRRKQPTSTSPYGGQDGTKNMPAGSHAAISPARSFMKQITAASRLPTLPKDQIKIIVRPKGGLNISKADIIRLAQALAMAAALTEQQTGEDTVCPNKVSAYIAAPDGTCKGVIRNINPSLDDGALKRMIVNPRNPKALEVRRIKNTNVVVILFDADVCASSAEEKNKCHGCGEAKSSESEEGVHQCTPKCEACGGPHITGDRTCRHRYHIPYIVRRRRRRRRQMARQAQMAGGDDASLSYPQGSSATPTTPPDSSFMQACSNSRGRSCSRRWPSSRKQGNTSASRTRNGTRGPTKVKGSGGESSTGKKTATAKKTRGKLQALGPIAGKPKRKAPYPETVSETDNEDEMAEPSEDTATAAAPPARSKGIGRLASIEKTLGRMMAMLSRMETRLTQLERPKVQAISRLTTSTVPKQANPNPDGVPKRRRISHESSASTVDFEDVISISESGEDVDSSDFSTDDEYACRQDSWHGRKTCSPSSTSKKVRTQAPGARKTLELQALL
ncbi:hypothetical protein HPB52_010856 [Rhipicephalus sanguineus]|uniref:Uncharacterized protein n=1 Tax=Rhipicephalus sanguineus TaxID=34632 RepID=A0A9D4T9K3_RHISA|nr:hypothetical protein HPB52_010856 [Rhipicephalus sanguineus]